jgi:hypothetical protein
LAPTGLGAPILFGNEAGIQLRLLGLDQLRQCPEKGEENFETMAMRLASSSVFLDFTSLDSVLSSEYKTLKQMAMRLTYSSVFLDLTKLDSVL